MSDQTSPPPNTPLPLERLARVIRSKNAGPAVLTLDLIFDSEETYHLVAAAADRLRAEVAERYATDPGQVKVIPYPIGRAVKITLPRRHVAGAPGDTDAYGAQQHVALLDIMI